ncbi:hypothetical protein NLG97_g3967 [Lecanicillium saksenae]|uniref:Uncharacterized protein n=1 Tax=Lecanicillium saksenae TaxID=468837 RepID=A0ACC1QWU4_9HYPO|nr:hypothetical protein NLG97_g3967 [Lecanicillium saksenae]
MDPPFYDAGAEALMVSICVAKPSLSMKAGQSLVSHICCIGAGFVAYQNPRIKVTVVDRDVGRIRRWNSKHPPIYEPGLHDILRVGRDGGCICKTQDAELSEDGRRFCAADCRKSNLHFTTDVVGCISTADIIFICVNTSTKERGIGAGCATDMAAFEAATAIVAQHAREGAIIVEKSTVPCRTSELVAEIVSIHRPGVHFEVISNPEFLAAGTAVNDLLHPSRIIIGCASTEPGRHAAQTLAAIYATWVPRDRILTTNIWSSELAKLVSNAMLAQRISSINSISAICERAGANIDEVARAVGLDPRIGSEFLVAGIGFGGSCFKKDVLSLVYLAEAMGLPEVSEYWRQVVAMNNYACSRFTNRIIKCLNNTLTGKKICILGYAFKKNTSDTRETPTLEMVKTLLQEGPREVAVFDPCCNPLVIRNEMRSLIGAVVDRAVTVYSNAYDACDDATAVIISTACDEFSNRGHQRETPVAHGATRLPKVTNERSDDDELIVGTLQQDATCQHQSWERFNGGITTPGSHFLYTFREEPPCDVDCPDCQHEQDDRAFSLETNHGNVTSSIRQQLDWERITDSMALPRWVFDGRGVIDVPRMTKCGVRVETIGR